MLSWENNGNHPTQNLLGMVLRDAPDAACAGCCFVFLQGGKAVAAEMLLNLPDPFVQRHCKLVQRHGSSRILRFGFEALRNVLLDSVSGRKFHDEPLDHGIRNPVSYVVPYLLALFTACSGHAETSGGWCTCCPIMPTLHEAIGQLLVDVTRTMRMLNDMAINMHKNGPNMNKLRCDQRKEVQPNHQKKGGRYIITQYQSTDIEKISIKFNQHMGPYEQTITTAAKKRRASHLHLGVATFHGGLRSCLGRNLTEVM